MLKIEDANKENLRDFINLCIPEDKKNDKFFIESSDVKEKWGIEMIKDLLE